MKLISLLFIFIQIGLAQSAWADFSLMTEKDKAIYLETMTSCRNTHSLVGAIANKNTLDSFLVSTGPYLTLTLGMTASPDQMQKATGHNMLSDFTADRLHSFGFVMAVKNCFPNNESMQSAFVLSMMTADTLGKVPTIIAMIYSFKGTKMLWGKFSAAFPKAALYLGWAAPASAVIYAVIESKAAIEKRQLTDYEKQRIERIKQGLKDNTEATKSMVNELANERVSELEEAFKFAASSEEKAKIIQQINKIKTAQQKL